MDWVHKTIGKLAICRARSQHRVPFFPTFPYPRKRRHGAATPSRRSTNESPRRGGARVYLHRESYHCSAGIKAAASGRRASPRTKPKRNRGPGSPRANFFSPQLRSSGPPPSSRANSSPGLRNRGVISDCWALKLSFQTVSEPEGAGFLAVVRVVSGVPAVTGSAGLDPAGLRPKDRVLGTGHYFGLSRCP